MTITLFYSPGACSISPHIALRESGLAFEIVRVDLGKKTYGPDGADYLKVCPKGYVPAVRLSDGQMLTENAVMIQYIADLVPEKHLATAAGTFERVRFAELLNFIATELHKGMSPMYNAKAGEEYKAFLEDRLTKRFLVLDGVPAKGKTLEQLEEALREQLARIAKDGVTEAEMRRVKAQWQASTTYQRDSLFNQAREMGAHWIEGLPLDASDRWMAALPSITPQQVQEVAKKYFVDEALTVAQLLPIPGARAPLRPMPPRARHSEALK